MRSALYSTMGISLLVGSFLVGTSDICNGGTRGVRVTRSGANEATEGISMIATTTADDASFILIMLLLMLFLVLHKRRKRDSCNSTTNDNPSIEIIKR